MAATAELFEEPFIADEYIERLAWRTPGGGSRGGAEAFDPSRLLEEFVNHIQELKMMDERIQRKVEKLEQQCQKEAKEFAKKVQELQKSNQVAFQHFQELDEHISYVATKVCHLGDQLEGVNTPRQRAVEAQKLMKYFNEFLDGELKSEVFTNSEKAFQEAFPDIPIGYSGHEVGIAISIAAVAMGAKVVERHVTMDKTLRGSDHQASLEPSELVKLVQSIRKVELALGSPIKHFLPCEAGLHSKMGKSVVAKVPIPAGTVLSVDMLTVKVAEVNGYPPEDIFKLEGKAVKKELKVDDVITEVVITEINGV